MRQSVKLSARILGLEVVAGVIAYLASGSAELALLAAASTGLFATISVSAFLSFVSGLTPWQASLSAAFLGVAVSLAIVLFSFFFGGFVAALVVPGDAFQDFAAGGYVTAELLSLVAVGILAVLGPGPIKVSRH